MHILPPNNLCILPSHDMVKNETRASRVSASGHRIISPNIGLHLHQNQKWFRRKVYFPITHLLNAPNQNGLVLQFCISCLTQWICFMFTLAETYFRHREYVVVSTAKPLHLKWNLLKVCKERFQGMRDDRLESPLSKGTLNLQQRILSLFQAWIISLSFHQY